ncbi:uncharacterized protein METZ01_LOCUS286626 [marine metagenome]|uniref:Uncharacterized protein n=1 Tax=marine metagenome TaxID=408172 RepID=A0A382LF67_9ZZZZ
MVRLFIVIAIVIIILIIFRNRRNKISNYPDIYKKLIFILIIGAVIFFLATSGRFILPQILQIIKIGIPFLTKFIGL